MDRVRAGNALGSEVAGFLDAAAQGRKRRSSLHELGLGPAIDAHAGVGVLLGVLDVPLRELPAAGVPLDVGEIPRQPVTVGRCALLKEARQLRLERVASAIQVAEAQKSATGELADRGEPDRNAVFICERRRTRDDVRLRTTCEVGAVGDDQERSGDQRAVAGFLARRNGLTRRSAASREIAAVKVVRAEREKDFGAQGHVRAHVGQRFGQPLTLVDIVCQPDLCQQDSRSAGTVEAADKEPVEQLSRIRKAAEPARCHAAASVRWNRCASSAGGVSRSASTASSAADSGAPRAEARAAASSSRSATTGSGSAVASARCRARVSTSS